MAAGSVNCSISSPPYWALRDYGVDGQLGLEKTLEEYIDKLCTIYDEVKRVLRADGTCWVNLGDTYNGSGGDHKAHHKNDASFQTGLMRGSRPTNAARVPTKSLCLIPQRFAIEMVNRGWILRNVIIWHKPNPMPSSAKDRFTVDFEYVYFFVKSKKYFFEPQYEPQSENSHARYPAGTEPPPARADSKELARPGYESWRETTPTHILPLGRNKRTVWTIPTQAYPDAHFATFPEKLVEPMILSGCPKEVCSKCGQGRRKVYETTYEFLRKSNIRDQPKQKARPDPFGFIGAVANAQHHFKGYTDCGCGEKFRPGLVMDPFMGSGTVGKVAAQNGHNWLGIELKQEYIEMAKRRIAEGETGISVKEQKNGQGGLFEQTQKKSP